MPQNSNNHVNILSHDSASLLGSAGSSHFGSLVRLLSDGDQDWNYLRSRSFTCLISGLKQLETGIAGAPQVSLYNLM